mgnify:CR=1 FL=1
MSFGLLGEKLGMTRIFNDDGSSTPVTVVRVGENRISQLKNKLTDGYCAVQVAFGKRRSNRVTKALKGHFAKASVLAGLKVGEFVVDASVLDGLQVGSDLSPERVFSVGQLVDVTGTSKGKGFAGVIKRHNFSSNRASHGNSVSHNTPGSIGQRQDPGRVFPGKRMAGHLGDVTTTVQNLKVVRIDSERGLILIHGAIPGAVGGFVKIKPAVKGGAK